MKQTESVMIGVRIPLEWIKKIDDLRRMEPNIPGRATILLQLVQVGLDEADKELKARSKTPLPSPK